MKKYILFGLFLLICYFPLFLHLDTLSLRLWDESRQAVNALEMALNGNFLLTYFDGHLEIWNTKPPLLIWMQVFFMKIVGYNELAVRLPSALAGLATVLLFFLYAHKVLKNKLLGYVFGLLLVTTHAYINRHGTRTGDYDAMLTLWENMYLLSFLTYTFATDLHKKTLLLWLSALGLVLAFLTKGIAGFFFLPALAIYALITGQLKDLLQSKHFYLVALTVFSIVVGYYFVKECVNPGYLTLVQKNELGGRFLDTLEGNQGGWFYYISDLYHHNRLGYWFFFLPLGLFLGCLKKGKTRLTILLILLNSLIVCLVLSLSATKLNWYLLPLYPLFIFVAAIGVTALIKGLRSILQAQEISKKSIDIATILFLFALLFSPYRAIIDRVYHPKDNQWQWQQTQYRDFMKKTTQYPHYTILTADYNGHVIFYKKIYNDTKKGYNVSSLMMDNFLIEKENGSVENNLPFVPSSKVMICEQRVQDTFAQHYEYKILEKWKECVLLEVQAKNKPTLLKIPDSEMK